MSEESEKKIDEEWKEQVRRDTASGADSQTPPESESEETASEEPSGEEPSHEQTAHLPPASFSALVMSLYTQALIALGGIENPVTGKREKDLPQARWTIDLLGILEDKTRGNLSNDEKNILEANLYQLRMRYVEAVK